MELGLVTEKMLMLFFIMMLGYAGRKAAVFDQTATKNFSSLVINITLPCSMLAAVSAEKSSSKSEAVFFILAVAVMMGLLAAVSKLGTALLKINQSERGIFEFLTIFSNNAFMGFPVIQAVFGAEALVLAAIYSLPVNLFMYSYGIILIAGKDQAKRKIDWRKMLNPAVVTSLASLVFYLIDLIWPAPVQNILDTVGAATTPLAMIVLGSSLADIRIKDTIKNPRVYIFSLIRLVIIPVAVWAAASRLFASPLIWGVLVVMAGMPSATAAVMICAEYGKPTRTASEYVFITTVLSVLTIPILAYLLF